MKQKFSILCIILLCLGFSVRPSYAVKVPVTEKIPGANCDYQSKSGKSQGSSQEACDIAAASEGDGATCRLVCDAGSNFSGVLDILGGIIKYFTFLAALVGVLLLVIGGIMYSMGGADDGMKTKGKEAIVKTLIGLIILLLSGLILNMIAPWVYMV